MLSSVVEEVLEQHGIEVGADLESTTEQTYIGGNEGQRMNEAAGWLRKMVGVVLGKDLPAEPSEQEFRLGLRSGKILCNVLNKVQPGSISKVIDTTTDPLAVPDEAALSAFHHNVSSFLAIIQGMGIPTFKPSDLQKGGNSARIVNCILALKSYNEWKQGGSNGLWRTPSYGKSSLSLSRRNSDSFSVVSSDMDLDDDTKSLGDFDNKIIPQLSNDFSSHMMTNSLNSLVRQLLSDKKPEEIPMLVESLLCKVTQEYEERLASQSKLLNSGEATTTQRSSEEATATQSPEEATTTQTNSEEATTTQNPEEATTTQTSSEEATTTQSPEEATTTQTSSEEATTTQTSSEEATTTQMSSEEATTTAIPSVEECIHEKDNNIHDDNDNDNDNDEEQRKAEEELESKARVLKQQQLLDKQKRKLEELRHDLHTTKEGLQFMETRYHQEFDSLSKYCVGLAHTASGYHKMAEENRKLYNQVQDLKGSIRVYCRVRPMSPGEANGTSAVDHIDEGQIRIVTPSKYGKEGHKSFRFNKVFGPSATQEEVFTDTRPLIRSVLDGYNVCIFAYGQTGSGKTHTMTGPKVLTEETLGVNYRALNDLFLLAEQRKDTVSYQISVQMIEIYNEQVRDLLATDGLTKRLEIRNSSQTGHNVPDANMLPVASTSDVIEVMNTGQKNRAVSATAANDRSSRSHSCITIHVQGKDLTSGSIMRGCMHLVDLAGSERVNKSEATGDRLKEAQHINKSLSALGDVIASLAQKNSHVPYRNSKLTQLLQDSLGGQAKTLMFVHIAPEYDAVGETLSTLKFAERVATVELGNAKPNQLQEGGDIRELKEQIASLKEALARKEGGEGRYVEASPSSSPERVRMGSSYPNESNISSADEKEIRGPREWVKVLMEGGGGGGRSGGQWDRVRSMPQSFYQSRSRLPDSSKVFPDQPFNKLVSTSGSGSGTGSGSASASASVSGSGKKESPVFDIPRSRVDASSGTDESEDLDATTSDSSEPDMLWQFSPVTGSRIKKPNPKLSKSPDSRTVHKSSSIPSLIPSPSRKGSSSTGYRPPLHQNGKQLPVVDAKKRSSVHRK